ncbi:hypothetical protein [Lacipirellula parvula]|uniref:hypothetical protein n=1 Tax=Lacipirellula parvula TaxID=2650471 RepID=UPI001260EE4B|nr:hypothetical protein [Lacipirellula parvula]
MLAAAIGLSIASQEVRGEEGTPPFPLMAWDYADDEETLQKMADCGINLVAFVPPEALDICHKLGIKAIVYQAGITPAHWAAPFNAEEANKTLPDLIKRVNDHPAVYGYHLKDEPDHSQFPELAKSVKVVHDLAPGKWAYINLPPGMGEGYDGYLDVYVNTCHPKILSYDNYPIGQEGNFSYGFWANIAQVRNAGLRHNLPFWNIFLSSAHLTYGEPSEAALRLQAYGSLVYGAKGLCYYKFISRELPILDAPELGDFRNGPLDQFGEKTHTWNWMRNMNRQIQNMGPTLLKLKSDVVYHVGDVPEQNRGVGEDTLVKGLKSGSDFAIGDFTHEDGSRWVMIVNKSLTHSTTLVPEFRDAVAKLEYLSPISGKMKEISPYYCLPPGQGVLLKPTFAPPAAEVSEK